jgi:serine/threonine protein kinase
MNTAALQESDEEPSLDPDAVSVGGSTPAARRLAPGTIVAGKYVIRGKLGLGGFSVVYDAEHLGLGRHVAIKVVHVDDDMPIGLLERSRREARNSALVRHPNVLEVFDTGVLDDGSPYLVMERIEGETLSKRIVRQGLSIAAVVELGRQLMLALEALAAHNMIHRDIKPENVMLHDRGDGRPIVKVVDFGIAKRTVPERDVRLTREGTLVGTPSYMSPEQLRGENLDERTDIYSAGAVLYEALTGRPPHDRTSLNELMLAALHDRVRAVRQLRPGCPRELERIVLKALAKAREDRYPTAAAMRHDLERFAAASALPTASNAWRVVELMEPARSARPKTFRKGLHLGVAAALLGLGAGAVQLVPHHTGSSQVGEPMPVVSALVTPRVEMLPVRGDDEPRLLKLDRPDRAPQVDVSSKQRSDSAASRERRTRRHRSQPASRVELPARDAVARSEAPVFAMRAAPAKSTHDVMDEALAAYTLGRYALAQELYRKVLASEPRELSALRGLGLVAARRGDHAEARVALERYLELAPRAADAPAIRARIAALPGRSAN